MRERKIGPASLASPEVQRDQRLRNLLPLLESLPEELRDAVVFTLDALVRAHNLAEAHRKRTKAGKA